MSLATQIKCSSKSIAKHEDIQSQEEMEDNIFETPLSLYWDINWVVES